jgi:hypothetical protein
MLVEEYDEEQATETAHEAAHAVAHEVLLEGRGAAGGRRRCYNRGDG